MVNSLVVLTSQAVNTLRNKKAMLRHQHQLVKSAQNVVVSYCSETKMVILSSLAAISQNAATQERLRLQTLPQLLKKKNVSKIVQIVMATWLKRKEDLVTSLAASIIQSAIIWKK